MSPLPHKGPLQSVSNTSLIVNVHAECIVSFKAREALGVVESVIMHELNCSCIITLVDHGSSALNGTMH